MNTFCTCYIIDTSPNILKNFYTAVVQESLDIRNNWNHFIIQLNINLVLIYVFNVIILCIWVFVCLF